MDSTKNNFAAGRGLKYLGIGVAGLLCGGVLQAAELLKFTNAGAISVSAAVQGTASVYPSTISTFFPKGKIASIKVTLNNVTHSFPDNLDVLMVGPDGTCIVLMSDAGANLPITNANLTFSEGAAPIPDASQIVTGTYAPANYGNTEIFPSPAPTTARATSLAAFKNSITTGMWSLFIYNDEDLNGGAIAGGWTITMLVDQPPVPRINGGADEVVNKRRVLLRGKAKDDLATVNQVFVRVNNSPLKLATGTRKWKFRANLKFGTNKIRVYAVDSTGNLSAPTIQRIIRVPSSTVL